MKTLNLDLIFRLVLAGLALFAACCGLRHATECGFCHWNPLHCGASRCLLIECVCVFWVTRERVW